MLKNEHLTDPQRQKEVSELLGPVDNDKFDELKAFSRLITDYVGEGEEATAGDALDEEMGVAVEVRRECGCSVWRTVLCMCGTWSHDGVQGRLCWQSRRLDTDMHSSWFVRCRHSIGVAHMVTARLTPDDLCVAVFTV